MNVKTNKIYHLGCPYLSLTLFCFLCLISDEAQIALPMQKSGFEKLPLSSQTLPPGFPAPFLFADGLSSVETLLTNIQVNPLHVYKRLNSLRGLYCCIKVGCVLCRVGRSGSAEGGRG